MWVKKQQNWTWNNGLVQKWERSRSRVFKVLLFNLFNLYAEYIMQNARRNINNLRYADDTTLMAESKEELKSLFISVKEE